MNAVRLLGRFRAPILALSAGMGFVVSGVTGQPLRCHSVEVAACLSEAGRGLGPGIHPAPGLPGLTVLGDSRSDATGPRPRTADGGGRGAPGLELDLRARAATIETCLHWSATASSASLRAKLALHRSGRLSAPSTAPPASPS